MRGLTRGCGSLELLLATKAILAPDAMAIDTVADGLASVNVDRPTPSTGG